MAFDGAFTSWWSNCCWFFLVYARIKVFMNPNITFDDGISEVRIGKTLNKRLA